MSADIRVELDLEPNALAGIYRWQSWPLALCDESTPTAADITELVTHVVTEVAAVDPGSYVSLGRVLAIRDTEMPNVIEVGLVIGVAWIEGDEDPDAPAPANRFTARSGDTGHDDLGPEGASR
jgi:hypothetical protein